MTKEDAKDYIREWCPYDKQDEIIKALEQEPILDNIKKVVAKWKADNFTDGFAWDCMQDIADIIDKAESEEKK